MRFRIPEIFLGIFLTVAVFALGMSFQWIKQPLQLSQTVEKAAASGDNTRTQSPDAELTGSTWLTKDAAGFFAFIAAVILIGQAIMFGIQLRYMRKGMNDAAIAANAARDGAIAAIAANKINQESAIADRRPWLAIENFRFSEPLAFTDGGAVASFEFSVRNFGSSPAMGVSSYVGIYARRQGDLKSESDAFVQEVLFRRSKVAETVFPNSFIEQAVASSIQQSEIDGAIVQASFGRVVYFSIWAGVSYETDAGTEYYTVTQFQMRGRLIDESSERSDPALYQTSTHAI
jgi:hypothetical protein